MEAEELRREDAREWIARCVEDLENARHDLTAKRAFIRDALFHCQQAVEKACKGFLTWHDESFAKTHNLLELGHLCARVDGRLRALPGRAAPLNEYAARFRYPGEPYEPTIEEAEKALELAGELVAQILGCLPEGLR